MLFNINFFRDPVTIKEAKSIDADGNEQISFYYYENQHGDELDTDGDGNPDTHGYRTSTQDSAEILQKTISSWYNAIRNICIVLMLSILVYIGIRMLLSSVASDKAKYLTMLKDWVIGLSLLFLMHYIMAFSVTLVEKLTDVVSTSIDDSKYVVMLGHTDQMESDLKEISDEYEKSLRIDENDPGQGYGWPTNLMGYLRLKAQMSKGGGQYIGEAIMFCILVIFTVIFTFTYLKRLLYMAFLTLMAPLVALTYCIDKLNDGQAQGFNKWFKEYIFNLLIQPMHLLLYYILVTSAFETMGDNIIYSIVAIGFMIPAEKLLRSLFGFEKAHTPPVMGPAAATMAGSALTALLHKRPGGKGLGDGKGGNSKDNDSGSDRVPMPRESNPVDAFTNNNESEQTDQQRMVDAYDDNYNSGEWDEQERDAMAREAYKDDNPRMQYSAEEQEQMARDILGDGATDEEVQAFMKDNFAQEGNTEAGQNETGTNPRMTNSNSTTPQSNQSQPTKKKGKIRRAVARKAHAYKAVGKTAWRNAPKLAGKGIRMAGSVAAGAALGTLAAGAGVAIGAATGDASNVIKYGGGAATAGYAMGSGVIKNAHMKHLSGEYKDAYDQAYNSPEYKEEAQADYVKEYRKDAATRNYFEQMFGAKEAKNMMKKGGEVEQCINEGITDKEEIAAIHKLQQENVGAETIEKAIAISQFGSMIGKDTNKMTKKSRGEWKDRIAEMAGKNSSIKDKDQFAEDRLTAIDKLNDIKSRL